MNRRFGLVHALAKCDTCGWTSPTWKNAQALASIHARKNGHVVNGEVAYAFTYDGTGP